MERGTGPVFAVLAAKPSGTGPLWGENVPLIRAAVLAFALASTAGNAVAGDICRKFVPSAGVTVEVPCAAAEAEAATAAPADTMERREGHELLGNAYRVVTLGDTAACEQACLADVKCAAAEYYHQKRGCGLFDTVPPVKRAKSIDVAIRKRAGGGTAPAKPVALPVGTAVVTPSDGRPTWCGEQQRFNEAEALVCADAELSALDVQLQRAFDAAVKAVTGGKPALAKLQKAEDVWAAMRDDCKANRTCLKAAYELRIEQLKQGVASAR